jgi:PAS domain S-box-containing protein
MRVDPTSIPPDVTHANPQFLLQVLASLNDHFVMFDREWRYTYVNDAAAQVLGLPKEALLGQQIWELFPNAVGTYFEQELRRAQREQTNLVFENYYPDWDQWFENRVYLAPDGLALLGIDITERKQAEERLRESDRRLRLALDAARMVAWEWDPLANQIMTTDQFADIYGMPAIQMVEQGMVLVHPDDRTRHQTIVEQVATEGGAYHSQFRIIRPDNGKIVWLEEWGYAELDTVGQVLRLVGVAMDISERKANETALRASQERFAKAFHASPQPMSITRIEDGSHIDVNEQFAQLVGYPRDEIIGRTSVEIGIWPDAQTRAEFTACQVRQGGTRNHEHRFTNRKGEVREIISAGEIIEVEGQSCILSVVTDVTERKAAEAALRASEEKFAKVFHTGPLAITITRLADGRVIEVNETFVQMSGFTREEALGRTPVELAFWVEPAKRDEGLAQLRAGQFPRNTEARFRMKDGTERICFISAELIELDGEPCVVTAVNDVTERRQTEVALRVSEANYRALFEGASDGIFIANEAGLYVDVNASACRLSGYTRDELLGKHLHDLTPPTYRSRLADDQAQLSAGGSQISEWALLCKDGSMRPIEVSVTQLPDGRWQAFVRDITERKRAERNQQFLNELNAQTRLLSDPEEIEQIVISRLSQYLGVDRSIIKAVDLATGRATITHAWGEGSAALAGHTYPLANFGSPDYIADALQGHTLVVENTATDSRTRGSQDPLLTHNVQALIRVPCFYQGQWVASLHVAQFTPRTWQADEVQLVETITHHFWPLIEKARVEQRLRTSEERLRLALEATNLGIWEMYPDQGEITWSAQCKAIHGLPVEREITRELVRETVYPADLAALQRALGDFYAPPRQQELNTEHRILHTDGTVRWIRVQGRFVDEAQKGQVPQRSLGTMLDITSQKQAEEEIATSRRFLERVAQAIPDTLMVYDLPSQRILYHNAGLLKVLGLHNRQDLAHSQVAIDAHIHPEDRAYAQEAFARLHTAADDDVIESTFRYQFPDGGYRWLQERTVVFARDGAGAVTQHLSISRDITERKESEADLRFLAELAELIRLAEAEEGLIQQVLAQTAQHLGVMRCSYSEVDVDRERLLTVQSHERTGEIPLLHDVPFAHFLDGSMREALLAGQTVVVNDAYHDGRIAATLFDEYAAQQVVAFVYVPLIRAERWVAGFAVTHDAVRLWNKREINLLTTVAERVWLAVEKVRLHAALRASEEKFAKAFRSGPLVITITRLADGRLIEVNETFVRTTGYTRAEALGRTPVEMGLWAEPAQRDRLLQQMQRGQAPRNQEFRFTMKGGQERTCLLSAELLEIDGQPCVLSVLNDITERKQAEEALRQLNATLEQRVRERTAELERSNRELDQFAYIASHDLKSPLRGIEHLANFILEDAAATLPESSQRHLTLIQGRIRRMEALLNDLLDYSRAGRHRYALERVEPATLIRETVDLLALPAGFVVEVVEPMPVLVGERVPLELIFRNLIGNAVKHHHQPAQGWVRISMVEQDDWVQVAVADNGPGIDPAFHERIFEIFQTLKPRDQVEGSGIGLTVVKKMIETRGGAIWVESTPGAGASFHFTWPKG